MHGICIVKTTQWVTAGYPLSPWQPNLPFLYMDCTAPSPDDNGENAKKDDNGENAKKDDNGENAKKVLTPIATEYIAKWKAAGKDPQLLFFCAGEDDDDIGTSLRQFAQFPKTNPLLAIVDIPSQKSYNTEVTEVTDKTVREFVEGFLDGTLSGKPLQG